MKSKKKQQPVYSEEFRKSAVKLAVESGHSRAATARDLGINVNTLHAWVSKYHESPGPESGATTELALEDQVKNLKKENSRLKEERDILKKAAVSSSCQREQDDERLLEKIKASHERSRQSYGARRIQNDLREDDEVISRTRISRLMREGELESTHKKKLKVTTQSDHKLPVSPNLLNRDFEPVSVSRLSAGS